MAALLDGHEPCRPSLHCQGRANAELCLPATRRRRTRCLRQFALRFDAVGQECTLNSWRTTFEALLNVVDAFHH
jgi:hypothetical protein